MAHDDHGHGHGHVHHDHAHGDDGHEHHGHDDHGHDDHGHALAAREPEELAEGAGRGKLLFFDAFSGAAGDMTIAALLDLGVPLDVIEHAVRALPLAGFHLHRGHVHRSGIVATTFDVQVDPGHPERTYREIAALLEQSSLDLGAKKLAARIFRCLGEAEARVHGLPIDEVHFHEVGAVDAIVDIVGSAAALSWLGAEVAASPLPIGYGFVHARHGVLPLPPPAVVECLRGVPTYAAGIEAELVTPTGAAILAGAAARFERWPAMSPERTGFGGGKRELADRPNLLRAVLGVPDAAATAGAHVVIEVNVDDMTGELAGHALSALLAAGALDAWATPILMKKGRPALTIAALTTADQGERVSGVMLRETSSIGVRRTPVTRIERPRRVVEVDTPYGAIPVKVSAGPFGPAQVKPEFDACARAAAEYAVTVREVIAAALHAAEHAGL
jgi:pyridinium-3,5-bisthiocarboxylic acid mononucleotide nickel chelatase